ncbi:eukaryotic peptide chain release factor subunit 1-like [Penaeus vannamei]|uniref:eukaryotic peptide chain release factor subunit 1-like n=1 Tax=Penaeus vannamei TaxID=6689 RepID=UPI00387F9174
MSSSDKVVEGQQDDAAPSSSQEQADRSVRKTSRSPPSQLKSGGYEEDATYGFVVIQGDHHTIAVGTINAFEIKFDREFAIANKHGRGGQSQNRFARLAEESRQNHLRAVYERMQRAFLAQDSSPAVDAVVVAGPGPMKADFMESLPRRWHPLTFEQPVTTTQAGPTGLQQLVAHMKEACSTSDALPDTNPLYFSGLGTGTHEDWLAPHVSCTMGNQGKVLCLREQRASRGTIKI